MRLLIFIHSLGNGGAERVAANLANHWAVKGWEITIVTLAPRDDDFYKLHPAVKRIDLDLVGDSRSVLAGLRQNLRRTLALRRVLRQINPEIALAMMSTANVLLALAAWGLPKIRTIGSERTYPPHSYLGTLWEVLRRLSYGRLAAVTVLTQENANWIRTHTDARNVSLIPNAALWPLPIQTPQISTDSLCQAGRRLLLAVGRLSHEKGFDYLLDAFSNLAEKHSDWDLMILGEGPLRPMLETQVKRAGLEMRVNFPGRAGNLREWYERADLYVMTSRFEGFPNTLVEAMAHGVPAVSFDCDTGPRDIIRHEIDGLLVPSEDLPSLITALDRLMSNIPLRVQYATRTIEVRERFSMERVSDMWEKLFMEILQ